MPEKLRKKISNSVHGLSHPSSRATLQEIRNKYVWTGIKKDITSWARICLSCRKAKIIKHNRLKLNKIDMTDGRFDHVHIDIVYMLRVNNYRYCLIMIDPCSRWPEAMPMVDMTANTVATLFLTHWISRFGFPKIITTDQGTQFESELFTALSNVVGAKRSRTSAFGIPPPG